jgi:hypothetical protein
MSLKHLLLVNIALLLLSILIRVTFGGKSPSGKLRCFGFWLRGIGRCWQILSWKLELLLFRELGKTNNFLMSLFPTIITKKILGNNVVFISFVGRITTVVARR